MSDEHNHLGVWLILYKSPDDKDSEASLITRNSVAAYDFCRETNEVVLHLVNKRDWPLGEFWMGRDPVAIKKLFDEADVIDGHSGQVIVGFDRSEHHDPADKFDIAYDEPNRLIPRHIIKPMQAQNG